MYPQYWSWRLGVMSTEVTSLGTHTTCGARTAVYSQLARKQG
jgi:hypothetical protein